MEKIWRSNSLVLSIQAFLFSLSIALFSIKAGIITMSVSGAVYALAALVIVSRTDLLMFDIEDMFIGASWCLWSLFSLCFTFSLDSNPHLLLITPILFVVIVVFYTFSVKLFKEDPGIPYFEGVIFLTPVLSSVYGLLRRPAQQREYA